jgi:hypothetical protein
LPLFNAVALPHIVFFAPFFLFFFAPFRLPLAVGLLVLKFVFCVYIFWWWLGLGFSLLSFLGFIFRFWAWFFVVVLVWFCGFAYCLKTLIWCGFEEKTKIA